MIVSETTIIGSNGSICGYFYDYNSFIKIWFHLVEFKTVQPSKAYHNFFYFHYYFVLLLILHRFLKHLSSKIHILYLADLTIHDYSVSKCIEVNNLLWPVIASSRKQRAVSTSIDGKPWFVMESASLIDHNGLTARPTQ